MKLTKTNKTSLIVIGSLFMMFYVYYSSLSYKIYKNIDHYSAKGNTASVRLSKKIIAEKYPLSFYHILSL